MSNTCEKFAVSMFSYEELVKACKNIGFDITCGCCAGAFFTGPDMCDRTTRTDHDPTCTTQPSYTDVLTMVQEEAGNTLDCHVALVLRKLEQTIRGLTARVDNKA